MEILLVDDEPLALENVYEIVPWEQYGFHVIAKTTSSLKALELFRKYRPLIVITDISMPNMDGLTLGRKIQELNPGTRLIFLTAYRDFDYVRQALELKASNYVLKHEISQNRLLDELLQIKEEVQLETTKLNRLKQNIIYDMVAGKAQSEEHTDVLLRPFLKELNGLLIMIYLKIPSLYTLDGEIRHEVSPLNEMILKELEKLHANQHQELHWLSMFATEDGGHIVVLKCINHHSYLFCWNEVQSFSRWLQSQYAVYTQAPIRPNLYVTLLTKREELHSSFLKLLSASRNGLFLTNGTVFAVQTESDSSFSNQTDDHQLLQSRLKPVIEALNKGNAELSLSLLDRLWDEILDKNQDEKGLRYVLRELGRVLSDQYQAAPHLLLGRNSMEIRDTLKQLIHTSLASNQTYSRWVLKAMEYVQEHYGNSDLSLELIAQHLQISIAHLRALFKRETGQTLSDYMTEYRIEKAKEMLRQGHYKIYEVSERVGYNSSQYFSKVFRKSTSKHPKDFT
ncbi:response regulator [Paenibacillus sp. LS1]|uniref:response regulator transcription factor n=1 Tax=Paenibacillus sp. LS1 TaxID=2992120 RepID=UPI002230D15F|nr:response regulator [Paenibacillus sp. LS1]MCW3790229.1 response regulator [Paenibacillus sp. LS1]